MVGVICFFCNKRMKLALNALLIVNKQALGVHFKKVLDLLANEFVRIGARNTQTTINKDY